MTVEQTSGSDWSDAFKDALDLGDLASRIETASVAR